MKNYPSLYTVDQLINQAKHIKTEINHKWVPARSIGYPSFFNRIRLSVIVFLGKGDVVIWSDGQ